MSDLALIQRVLIGGVTGATLAALLLTGNVTLTDRVEGISSAVDVLAALLAILLFGVTLIVTAFGSQSLTRQRGEVVAQVVRSFFTSFRVVLLAAALTLVYRVGAAELHSRSELAEAAAFSLAAGAFAASFACAWTLASTTYQLARHNLVGADGHGR